MNSYKKAIYISSAVFLIFLYGVLAAIVITRADQWRVAKARKYLTEANKVDDDANKLTIFEKAALLNPSEETYLLVGVQAMKLGDSNLAEQYFGRVKTAEGYHQLGNAYYNLGKYELAVTSLVKSLAIGETDRANQALGKSYLKLGDLENGKKYLVKVKASDDKRLLVLLGADSDNSNVSRETNPANKAVLIYNEFIRLGYPQSARTVLKQATANGQLSRDSLIVLADSEIMKGEYQEAYDNLLRAKLIDPYYPQIYKQLIIVCEKLSKTSELKQYSEYYFLLVI